MGLPMLASEWAGAAGDRQAAAYEGLQGRLEVLCAHMRGLLSFASVHDVHCAPKTRQTRLPTSAHYANW